MPTAFTLLACSGSSDEGQKAASGGAAGAAASGGAAGTASGGAAGTASGGAAGGGGSAGAGGGAGGAAGAPGSGSFSVLTYNVAGLPQGISGGNPIVNTPLISPLLNSFDLVYVQEDFTYHAELISAVTHPYKSLPLSTGGALGDGLNRLARFEFSDFGREAWQVCNGTLGSGSDCLTKKGFSFGRHHFADGAFVDVYNLHMDAGHNDQADYQAREAQAQQLVAAIAVHSPKVPVIVVGDTNLKDTQDETTLQAVLVGAGLKDACRSLNCPEPGRIDRVMFRGNPTLTLTPKNWRVEPSFVDAAGKPLSDHEAVAVDFDWSGKSQ